MKATTVLLAVLAVAAAAMPAWAQGRGPQSAQSGWGFQQQQHRIEILGYGGYLWSDAIDVNYGAVYGEADVTSGEIWGIEADINVRPGTQVVLLYNRMDSELSFEPQTGLPGVAGDIAIENWHIGGLGGVQRGNIMPFAMFTLGGTRIIPEFDGSTGDEWRFSILFGIGAKVYINERVGLRVQGRMPWIFVDSGAAVGCGSGGCYTMFGGSGIVQADVSGGLFIMF